MKISISTAKKALITGIVLAAWGLALFTHPPRESHQICGHEELQPGEVCHRLLGPDENYDNDVSGDRAANAWQSSLMMAAGVVLTVGGGTVLVMKRRPRFAETPDSQHGRNDLS